MKKRKERMLSILLTFVMVVSLFAGMAPVEVQAETNPISITTQPASTTVNLGEQATFTVEAQATGALTYQWQVDYGSGSGFVKTYESGNNTATLTT